MTISEHFMMDLYQCVGKVLFRLLKPLNFANIDKLQQKVRFLIVLDVEKKN